VARDVTTLLSTTMSSVGPQQLAARRDSLPEPVRRYLRFAIEDGAPATRTVRLEHGGTFRTKPEQRWLPMRLLAEAFWFPYRGRAEASLPGLEQQKRALARA
jgi:hypothetical protein